MSPRADEPAAGAASIDAAFRRFLCRACGYVYDEALGDPDGGLPPGTRFDAIPDDWMCPLCGVGKQDLEPMPATTARAPAPLRTAGPAAGRTVAIRRGPAQPIVVIGAGTAGWAAATAIREADPGAAIVVVTGCDGDVYHKPQISVALSGGREPAAMIVRDGAAQAALLGATLHPRTRVLAIDVRRRCLRTTRGDVRYGRLVIASGAAPAPVPGGGDGLLWRINDLAAYAGFRRALGDGPRSVAVVGAGLVGCELADDLAQAGHRVTLIEPAAAPLARLLPAPASAMLAQALQARGIALLTGRAVVSVAADRNGVRIALDDGGVVTADLGVSATGLVVPTRLARSAGLRFDNGIAVGAATMRTSEPGIHALGDCVSIAGRPSRFIEPIGRQARLVAQALRQPPDGDAAPGAHEPETPDPATVALVQVKTRSCRIALRGRPPSPGDTDAWEVVAQQADRLTMRSRHARLELRIAPAAAAPAARSGS